MYLLVGNSHIIYIRRLVILFQLFPVNIYPVLDNLNRLSGKPYDSFNVIVGIFIPLGLEYDNIASFGSRGIVYDTVHKDDIAIMKHWVHRIPYGADSLAEIPHSHESQKAYNGNLEYPDSDSRKIFKVDADSFSSWP